MIAKARQLGFVRFCSDGMAVLQLPDAAAEPGADSRVPGGDRPQGRTEEKSPEGALF